MSDAIHDILKANPVLADGTFASQLKTHAMIEQYADEKGMTGDDKARFVGHVMKEWMRRGKFK